MLVDSSDHGRILQELKENKCCLSEATRFYLARKVFALTANYDASVSNYLGSFDDEKGHLNFPLTYTMQFQKSQDLRYGENPHQTAAFYKQGQPTKEHSRMLANFKERSFPITILLMLM